MHWVSWGDVYLEAGVVGDEQAVQQLLAHGLGDADALAVGIHLNQQLQFWV